MQKRLPSLPVYMAIGPLRAVTHKQLLGGEYVRAGDYIATLATLYESCAALGKMFQVDVATLAQLLLVKAGNEDAFMAFLKSAATERLGRYQSIYSRDPDTLFSLVAATEYAKSGFVYPQGDVGSASDLERVGRAAQGKVDIKSDNAWKRLEMTLTEGFGFGLQYPELTWDLFSRNHQPEDCKNREWQEYSSLTSCQLPDGLATDSPQQAKELLGSLVRGYAQQYRPDLVPTLRL